MDQVQRDHRLIFMSHITNHNNTTNAMISTKTNGQLAVMVEDLAEQMSSPIIEEELYWQVDYLYGQCVEELVRRGSW